jgi:putative membrane protein
MGGKSESDPRVYFAQERTFLAWIRTGLGLMGVGFAVARFGLFLREMATKPGAAGPHTTGLSVVSGVALVSIGVLVTVNAAVRHVLITRALREGTWVPGQVSKSALVLAGVLAVIGVAMAAYLLLMR